MNCPACQAHKTDPLCGRYRAQCVQCGARLLESAKPLKNAAKSHLAAIAFHPDAPSRAEILACLKGMQRCDNFARKSNDPTKTV